MRWHESPYVKDKNLSHAPNSIAWKTFDDTLVDFSADS